MSPDHFRVDGKTISDWINGPEVESDEYDTELEDDFPPGKQKNSNFDLTGKVQKGTRTFLHADFHNLV